MKKTALIFKYAAALGVVMQIAACATPPEPVIDVRTVRVAVPVPCREPVPPRPDMPLDSYSAAAGLDGFVAAALAEREVREGWEGELLTALRACTAP